ncbi:tyrosine--tRNA ligase [Flavobacteriales bacterium]|nr:tyrosine--tRNA ligase [Flavobacteriales bacterium]
MDLIKELTWRGMLHDSMPGMKEHLAEEMRAAYVGIDPTADSLHIGHLVSVMMLKHLQVAGHKPIALVGGATGMIGDPSGKSAERNLLDEETLRKNEEGLKKQLKKFLDFESNEKNAAELVNNYDWMKDFSFLGFIRDVGKHITVNYMMAKDSVKKRIAGEDSEGMSFTEFTYQLVQGYDFLHLYKEKNCTIQMGGSDQWGNIVTGTELIRRIGGGKAFAATCPLITKADGGKFGKTESGNIWLDPEKTSTYKFYQFWLNTSDEDAEKYIKIFTLFGKEEIEKLVNTHSEAPHLRILQRELAKDITVRVHSLDEYENAVKASEILFKKGQEAVDGLKSLSASLIQDIFEGVPQATFSKSELANGIDIVSAFVKKGNFLSSNGEARRELKQNSISVNKAKVNDTCVLTEEDLIGGKYILLQKGKKNNYLVTVE